MDGKKFKGKAPLVLQAEAGKQLVQMKEASCWDSLVRHLSSLAIAMELMVRRY